MNAPDLDLDLVRCFLAVVESRSFTSASRQLNLSQSAVSLKIQRLEATLGQRVFVRQTRSIALTPEGELVLLYAHRLLDLGQEMLKQVAHSQVQGMLRLGVIQQLDQQFLPNLLRQFKRQHPNVGLTVEAGMTVDLLRALEEDRFDLVLGAAGHAPRSGQNKYAYVEHRVLLREPAVWVQSSSSDLDLTKEMLPLILFPAPCGLRKIVLERLEKRARPWQVVYSSASLASIQTAVQADLGISALARSAVLPGMKIISGAGLPPLPDAAITLYSRKTPYDSLARSLTEFIAAALTRWHADRSPKTRTSGQQNLRKPMGRRARSAA
ncbi:MAG: LysR family transcriptional regulator [Prosthecobacter sp.]